LFLIKHNAINSKSLSYVIILNGIAGIKMKLTYGKKYEHKLLKCGERKTLRTV